MPYLSILRTQGRFLAFGFTLVFFSSIGQTYFVGMFGGRLREAFAISHGDYGMYYMLATVASGTLLLRVGRTIDRVDLRLYAGLSVAGGVAACFLMSAAASAAMLVVALFAVRFTGQGLMSHTAFTSMGRYFEADRAKAISLAGLGFAVGSAVFPSLAVALLAVTDWRSAWRWIGLAVAVLLVPLVLWLLRGHADRHRRWLARTRGSAGSAAPTAGDEPEGPRQWTRGEVLRDRRFYLLIPAVLSPTFLLTGFMFHHVKLAEVKGWSEAWLAACFIAFAAGGMVTSLVLGPLTDRWRAVRIVRFYLLPVGLAMVILALFRHPAVAAIYLGLVGVTTGAATPVLGSLWVDYYGVLHLGAIRALTSSLMVVSTALGPYAMGLLLDAGLTMETIAWLSLCYVAIGVVLIAFATRRAG